METVLIYINFLFVQA